MRSILVNITARSLDSRKPRPRFEEDWLPAGLVCFRSRPSDRVIGLPMSERVRPWKITSPPT